MHPSEVVCRIQESNSRKETACLVEQVVEHHIQAEAAVRNPEVAASIQVVVASIRLAVASIRAEVENIRAVLANIPGVVADTEGEASIQSEEADQGN